MRITKPFYLGVYEVTQEEYERVTGTNPSGFSRAGSGIRTGYREWTQVAFLWRGFLGMMRVEFCQQVVCFARREVGGACLPFADRSRMGIYMPGGHHDAVPLRESVERPGSELQDGEPFRTGLRQRVQTWGER